MTIVCPLCRKGEPLKIIRLRLGSDYHVELDQIGLRRHVITYHLPPNSGDGEPIPLDHAA